MDYCIYHANCMDGVTAAAVVLKKFPGIVCVPAGYGDPVPADVDGKNVVVVDFSYKHDGMIELIGRADRVLVLDHHKTAEEVLTGVPALKLLPADAFYGSWVKTNKEKACALFDMERSGAGLAWDFFYGPKIERPAVIDLVEDRDLWRFAHEQSKPMHQYLASLDAGPDMMVRQIDWVQNNLISAVDQGTALLRRHALLVKETIAAGATTVVIGGVEVPCCNATYNLASDIGNELSKGKPFAATYFDHGGGRNWSLRSDADGADVSEIAKRFGGGGHAHAAGFRTTRGWFGDLGPVDV